MKSEQASRRDVIFHLKRALQIPAIYALSYYPAGGALMSMALIRWTPIAVLPPMSIAYSKARSQPTTS